MPDMLLPQAVVPVLVGPLQVLLTILPGLLLAALGGLAALFKPSAMKKGLQLLWRLKFTLVPVAAAVVGFIYLLPVVLPGDRAAAGERVEGRDWPMFRAGPARRGAPENAESPVQGGVQWTFDHVPTFYSSPTVVGNRVYVTSADKGVYRDSGSIYCLDADTGAIVWVTRPDGYRATFSSPAVSGNRLVVGEGLHFTQNARVVCVDISPEAGGRILWEYRTASHVESSPCISDGRAYIGAGDDGYYCFELEPDAEGNAQVVWHLPGEEYPDAETPPVVADGKVFVGLGVGGNAVCCLDAETGDELWRVETPYPVMSPPTVANGRVFVGMGNGNFIQTAEQVLQAELRKLKDEGAGPDRIAEARNRLQPAGEVWAINVENPQDRWTVSVPRTVLGAVAASDGKLYFGSRDGHLHCITQDGQEVGKWNAHEPIVASPACTDRCVYFVTASGRLYALDRETLQPVWDVQLGAGGRFLSSPAVARGHVYVGTEKDGLLCVGKPQTEEDRPVWAGPLGGPGRGGALTPELLPERGSYLWSYPEAEGGSAPSLQITAPAAAIGGKLYVPFAGGDRKGLACLQDTEEGRAIARELWFHETSNGVTISPAATEEHVFGVDGAPGDENRALFCLDPADGAELWSSPVAPGATGHFLLVDDGIYIQNSPGTLTFLNLTGEAQWQADVGTLSGTPDRTGAILLAATTSEPALMAVDAVSGRELWRADLGAAPTTGPVIRGKTVFVGTKTGIRARSLLDGNDLWSGPEEQVSSAITVTRESVAYVTHAGDLVVLDPQDGSESARCAGAVSGVPPVLAQGGILFAAEQALMVCNPGEEPPSRWMDISWLGRPSSPMIMASRRVYFATDQQGFIRAGEWK